MRIPERKELYEQVGYKAGAALFADDFTSTACRCASSAEEDAEKLRPTFQASIFGETGPR